MSTEGDIKILVIHAGWVLIGYVDTSVATEYRVTRGRVVSTWGTTKGLGQIAIDGPTKDTRLDFLGPVARIHPIQVLFSIDCVPKSWTQHLT